MPSSQNGNLGLNSGYTAGDNGWTAQHNFNWDALDALTQATVKSMTTTAPPGSPANGDAYIVPAGATGAWASQTNKIAAWQRSAWAFYTPKNGWQVYNQTDGGDYLYNGSAWVLQGSQKLNVPQDYISGLKMVWNSGTSISISSGAAFVQSLGRLVQPASTLTLSSLSLSASTWYHIYLYENAGTPAIECVTTAPVSYFGSAMSKTGDQSRRYLGSVVTDGSGNIQGFTHYSGNRILYDAGAGGGAPFRVLSNGTATSPTAVSFIGVLPTTSQISILSLTTNSTTVYFRVRKSTSAAIFTSCPQVASASASPPVIIDMPSPSQGVAYDCSAAGGAAYIDVIGYVFER